jgi:HlyD family secretion protein
MRQSTWLAAAVCATVLIWTAAWTFRPRPEVQVESARVTVGSITRRILATGTVTPMTTVAVGTQVSGIVQSLGADFDSIVRAGAVIARLDPSLYQAALDEARARLAQATAALDQAQADLVGLRTAEADARMKLDRAQALGINGLIPAADLDAAQIAMNEATADVRSGEARVNQARAAIAQATADVEQASVDLDHTVIRSPIDGIVVARNVDVGQTLAATVQAPVLFNIATDFKRILVQVDIDEADIDGVTDGEAATFQVESYPGETFHGMVTQLRAQSVAEQTATATTVPTSTSSATTSVVATVVSYTAIIEVANPDEKLRPGMTAEVALGGSRREQAVRIPNRALAFRPSADVLQALGEPDPVRSRAAADANSSDARTSDVWEYDGKRFTPIAVRTGLADDTWTEILSGSIHPGDVVVTSAALRPRSRM